MIDLARFVTKVESQLSNIASVDIATPHELSSAIFQQLRLSELSEDLVATISRLTLLGDARYQLRFDTSLIIASGDPANRLLDDDLVDDAIRRFDFHRLLGDFDGDAEVDVTDRNLFFARYGARPVA